MKQESQLIQLFPHSNYRKQAESFVKQYEPMQAIFPFKSSTELKPRHERVCRFCGKDVLATTFKETAHTIPEMLGNKLMFSDFECDNCNALFGKEFENDLSYYLGISRTITGTKGKRKVPTFTAPGNALKAKSENILGEETIIISRDDVTNGTITVNKEQGTMTVKGKKIPFRPLRVYKAILKIALSLLPENDIRDFYKPAIDFLMGRGNIKFIGCVMSGYQLPLTFNFPPHAFIFKKRETHAMIHSHVVALYFQNIIISIPVPLNCNDSFFRNTQKITIPLYPPLFTQATNFKDLQLLPFAEDFSSDEKKKGSVDEIAVQINPEELKKSAEFNINTGELLNAPFNPDEIVQVIIRQRSDSINPQKLADELRRKGYTS